MWYINEYDGKTFFYHAKKVFWYQVEKWWEIERVVWKFRPTHPPTHPCIAMKKMLKDLAYEKRKFKICKTFEKSALSSASSTSHTIILMSMK